MSDPTPETVPAPATDKPAKKSKPATPKKEDEIAKDFVRTVLEDALVKAVEALKLEVATAVAPISAKLEGMEKENASLLEWSNRATQAFNNLTEAWNAFATASSKGPNVADAIQKFLPQITQEQERLDRIERYVGATYKLALAASQKKKE